MRSVLILSGALAVAFLGCATSSGSTATSADAPLTGEIKCAFSGSSFGPTRVVGPKVNMTQRSDGTWGGTMGDQPIDADYKNGKLSGGPNLTLVISKVGDKTVITGQFKNRILRYEISEAGLMIRTDVRSVDYPKSSPGTYGYAGEVKFLGEAEKAPLTPAFALAVASAFL